MHIRGQRAYEASGAAINAIRKISSAFALPG